MPQLDPELILAVDNPDAIRWHIEVDVLVVGAGGCGLVAALKAAETGAEVFVLEKEKEPGGNTSLSQAMVPAAGTQAQTVAGIIDSPALMTEDILKKNHHGSDPELTLHIAEQSSGLVAWLKEKAKIDLDLVSDFLYPGHSVLRIHANKSRKGKQLIHELVKAVQEFDNINLACNAPAKRLIVNSKDQSVLGVEVEIEGIGINLARAKKTILALNGFGANREMLEKYIPEMSAAYYFGHEGNTGEGILWGQALGAKLENMGAYQAHGSVAHPHGTLLTWAVISLGGFQVNLDGRRFVNEYHGYSEHALDVLAQKEGVAVEIFDHRIYKAVENYEDFRLCMEMGAIKKFDTIDELAVGFGLPADAFALTFEQFEAARAAKISDPLGRTVFGEPLSAPFYGVKVTGALFHTQGGLAVDKAARVLTEKGTVIPNLYAGGGSAAGFSGRQGPSGYLSANGLMAALILGMIAGEEAGRAVLP
jgi:fumarate reductase flavoprotein subunit